MVARETPRNGGWCAAIGTFLMLFSTMTCPSAAEDQTPREPTAEAVLMELSCVYQEKRRAYLERDAAILADRFYSPDVMLVAAESNTVLVGREQILAVFSKILPNRRAVEITPLLTRVSNDRNQAVDIVNVVVHQADETQPPANFREIFVWERLSGQWRVVAEVAMPGAFEPATGIDLPRPQSLVIPATPIAGTAKPPGDQSTTCPQRPTLK